MWVSNEIHTECSRYQSKGNVQEMSEGNLMTDPFERAEKVYAALNSHAKMKSGTKMFAGSKVDVFDEAGVSRAYYSEVYDSLTASGCIEGVSLGGGRRGASSSRSYVLQHVRHLFPYRVESG